MAIIKGVRVYVIDTNDNVVADLGMVPYPALIYTRGGLDNLVDARYNDVTYFAPYTPDYSVIGSGLTSYQDDTTIISETFPYTAFSRFLIFAPITQRVLTMGWANSTYRIKLSDDRTGYYAVSVNNINSQGYISGSWKLYNNNDTLMGTVGSIAHAFPLSDTASVTCIMPHSMAGGYITGTESSVLSVYFGYSTKYQCRLKITSYSISQNFINWYNALTPYVVTDDDPYEDFPHTEEGGGDPNPDPADDDITESPLPTLSFADTGFARIYRPSLSQLNSLANYMWTDTTFLQTLINHAKQLLENPIDSIISLSLVPCVPSVGSDVEVKVMYIPTGVYMPPVANQFVEVDCGTVLLEEMYGSALDYNPYTRVQLYLPYIGTVQLDTDEVMNKTLHVKYRIDVVTGLCCAYVSAGADILYQFSGHCSVSQPINSADFSGYIGAAMATGKLVGAVVSAGAGAPAIATTLVGGSAPSSSTSVRDVRETTRNKETGRQITSGTTHEEVSRSSSGASFGEIAARGVSNTVGAVMNSKTIIQHSGGFSGNSGYIAGVRRPYLIVTRPRIANPVNYGKYNGRPSMLNLTLSECSGYTQVQSIQLTGIDAMNPELSEIATLLMSGVIF